MEMPTRDGARLMTVASVPRHASPRRRYPIVLQRTPFSVGPNDSTRITLTFAPDAFMLRDGYIFVAQEVRGRYRSEGTLENMRPLRAPPNRAADDEATDAYDTIAWLLTHLEGNGGREHGFRTVNLTRRAPSRPAPRQSRAFHRVRAQGISQTSLAASIAHSRPTAQEGAATWRAP